MFFGRIASLAMATAAVLGVFVEIPIVSDYAFWVMAANYLIIVSATGSSYLIIVVN